MDPVVAPLAVGIGIVGAVTGRVVAAATGRAGDPVPTYITQLGVTGACIVVAWWMLRRSDSRDRAAQEEVAKAREAADRARTAAYKQMEARAESERRRADAAEDRAELMKDRLTDSYRDQTSGQE